MIYSIFTSSPRRRGSTQTVGIDSRLRGSDGFCFAGLCGSDGFCFAGLCGSDSDFVARLSGSDVMITMISDGTINNNANGAALCQPHHPKAPRH